jgi:hypothetical protein
MNLSHYHIETTLFKEPFYQSLGLDMSYESEVICLLEFSWKRNITWSLMNLDYCLLTVPMSND